jgi:uncharacterized protein YjbI with pentapeptide repeats
MADGKIDPFDVAALERSVNESAGRVSGIWLSFVAFSAYLAAAASMISHRQIFLEEPIKLPTINIDLPLLASAILLPVLFVIYHVFVLLQVVLLARTADAYNDAIEHGVTDVADRTRIRQRLANTLFAQLFAGSPREREGLVGWLLRLMTWITLAIGPVCVLLVFEIKFLPYHHLPVTWIHRLLIALDLVAVLLLWAGAVDPRRDISGRSLIAHPRTALAALVFAGLWWTLVTIPGEPTRTLMRQMSSVNLTDHEHPDCWAPGFVAALFSDSLALQGEDFVDDEKLVKIVAVAKANGLPPSRSERTRVLRGRDLRCGHLAGVDLRRADFSGADLSGISLKGAHLDGAAFSGARLEQAILDSAQLQDAYFAAEEDNNVKNADELMKPAGLIGASLQGAQLQGASFKGTRMQGASLDHAQLQGADLDEAQLQGATLSGARLDGATLQRASMQAVQMVTARAIGASFAEASLQAAVLGSVDFEGSDFERTLLQGARFNNGRLSLSRFSASALWRATGPRCQDAVISDPDFGAFIGFELVGGDTRANPAKLVPIKPEPAAVDTFIEQASRFVPESAAGQLRTLLKDRLAPKDPDTSAEQSEKGWSRCAEETVIPEDLQQQRVNLFAIFSCEPGANSRYVAEGIARLRWRLLDAAGARLLARRLLERDGKPCPGAKDLSDSIKAELMETAG